MSDILDIKHENRWRRLLGTQVTWLYRWRWGGWTKSSNFAMGINFAAQIHDSLSPLWHRGTMGLYARFHLIIYILFLYTFLKSHTFWDWHSFESNQNTLTWVPNFQLKLSSNTEYSVDWIESVKLVTWPCHSCCSLMPPVYLYILKMPRILA